MTSLRSSTDPAARRVRRAAAALLAGALLAAAAAAAPPSPAPPADPGARARTILSDPRYQRALPSSTPGDGDGEPSSQRRGPAGDLAPGDRAVEKPFELPSDLAVLFQWVLVLVAIAVLGLVALWGFRSARETGLRRRSKAAAAVGGSPERRPETGTSLGDADRLAAEERWSEALHALLLQAIRVLSAGSPVPLRPSYTSRELLGLVQLSGEAQQAFAGLVRAVEQSLFGGAQVGPDEYRENRERLQILHGGAR